MEKLDKIRDTLEKFKVFPEENVILIILKLLEAKSDLTANEISSRLNNDGIELTSHQISSYFKKRKLLKIIKINKKTPYRYTIKEILLKEF